MRPSVTYRLRAATCVVVLATTFLGDAAVRAAPTTLVLPTWIAAEGSVDAVALSGTTAYLGGDFAYVGPNTEGFASFDVSSGALDPAWPRSSATARHSPPTGPAVGTSGVPSRRPAGSHGSGSRTSARTAPSTRTGAERGRRRPRARGGGLDRLRGRRVPDGERGSRAPTSPPSTRAPAPAGDDAGPAHGVAVLAGQASSHSQAFRPALAALARFLNILILRSRRVRSVPTPLASELRTAATGVRGDMRTLQRHPRLPGEHTGHTAARLAAARPSQRR
jgi:hypothetical protein